LKGDLQKHQFVHNETKGFVCSIDGCGKSFSIQANLTRHKKTIHENVRKFSCPTCNHSFSQSGDLKRHEKIHKGERDFSCNTCSKTFVQKIHLITHLRTHNK